LPSAGARDTCAHRLRANQLPRTTFEASAIWKRICTISFQNCRGFESTFGSTRMSSPARIWYAWPLSSKLPSRCAMMMREVSAFWV
jgi:hypothetical protein